jgi:hypothetical protein
MPTTSGYAKYADFLGEVSPEEEARQAAERQARASTPESQFAQRLAQQKQTVFGNANTRAVQQAPSGTISSASQFRSQQLGSGERVAVTPPGQYGQFSYTRQGKPASAYAANAPNDLLGDVARLGTYIGTAGPASDAVRAYLGPEVATITNPFHAVADEGLDLLLPKGSGAYGTNIIPGVKGTGGDSFYPSESLLTGGYNDGYRGAGNPRSNVAGAGQGGAGGTQPATGVQRPDQYRTDALNPDIRSMLDQERAGGPSEAEALLQTATDRVAARSLGIAAGARGGAGARERARNQAVSANTSLGASANADLAALRARENAESRQRQAAIMATLQNNAAAGDVRDLGYEQTASGERQARYNIDATNARFNAGQAPGLLDDPLAWLFEATTGGNLRSRTV